VTKFLQNLIAEGKPNIRVEDEIIRDTLVTHHGNVVHPKLVTAAA
jgi:NAD/NADP transhydrogenase alpha subunit